MGAIQKQTTRANDKQMSSAKNVDVRIFYSLNHVLSLPRDTYLCMLQEYGYRYLPARGVDKRMLAGDIVTSIPEMLRSSSDCV